MLDHILDTIRDRIADRLEGCFEEFHESCSLLGYSAWEKIGFRLRSGFWWYLGKLL
jgi:hypothetical protein